MFGWSFEMSAAPGGGCRLLGWNLHYTRNVASLRCAFGTDGPIVDSVSTMQAIRHLEFGVRVGKIQFRNLKDWLLECSKQELAIGCSNGCRYGFR